jgi:hypothetical protein
MANSKISALPTATPLQGGELIAVVQDGSTKQSAIENIVNYIVPVSLVVSDGQTINLQDEIYEKAELIRMTWDGANGTMTLNLPTAAQHPNRVMRFISNGGFATATRVNLTPTGTELLDGANASYVINKPYEGIQVWTDGIEWFIIQKKG